MSYKGRENPVELPCFRVCQACYRCEDKGRYTKCNSCSGRNDPDLKRDPYDIDDKCRCSEGILQIRLQNGKMIQTKYPGNPYKGSVKTDAPSQDEVDWQRHLYEARSFLNDEEYDPVRFMDGTSTDKWTKEARGE